ncbi:MAG TPA: carboxypeptidase regulatory-like domain-containing protein [Streptosporangiaceae bacterium]
MSHAHSRLAVISASISIFTGIAIPALPAGAAVAGQAARPATAAGTPASAGTRPGPAAGVLTGMVRGPDGLPVPGACVTAVGLGGTITRPASAGGRYLLAGLAPGQYRVEFRDCASPARYFAQWYRDATLSPASAPVTVAAGGAVRLAPVTLRLTSPAAEMAALSRAGRAGSPVATPAARAGHISGIVRSRTGRRLSGACAWATGPDGEWWGFPTGRRGGYAIPVGTSGTWTMTFLGGCGSSGNWAPQWWRYARTVKKATRLHEKKGRGFAGIDARLRPGAAISGRVTAADGGKALAGACVTVTGTGAMSEFQYQATSGAGGRYLVKNLGTGSYRVAVDPSCGVSGSYLGTRYPRAVKATDGRTTTGVDVALKSGVTLSGVVTSQATGKPVGHACVNLLGPRLVIADAADKDGRYTVTDVPPGRYLVGFTGGCGNAGSYAPVNYSGQAIAAAATPVDLAAGQVAAGISAALPPGATISGQLRSASGRELRRACVQIDPVLVLQLDGGTVPYPLASAVELDGLAAGVTFTSGSGRFRAASLPPGRYQVSYWGCDGAASQAGEATFAPQGGTGWISVAPGAVTSVSAKLASGGTISGRLTGQPGDRLADTCALAVPARQAAGAAELGGSVGAGVSRSGRYTIRSLRTGRYAVQFAPCGGGALPPQWYDSGASRAAARLVSIRAGHATTGISMRLAGGGKIEGKVVGPSGKPASGYCVTLSDRSGWTTLNTQTGTAGIYRIGHVLPGRWAVQVSPCGPASALGAVAVTGRVRDARLTRLPVVRLPRAGAVTGAVTGTATGGAGPVAQPGICVTATPASGTGLPGLAVTDARGHYDLGGLAPGSYRIEFSSDCEPGTAALATQWYGGGPGAGPGRLVTVTGGQVTFGIGADLTGDGDMSGTVTSAAAPVPGVCVGAYAGAARTPSEIAITGTSGGYQLAGLVPGRYTVEFTAGCGDASYRTQWYDGAASRAAATPVTVSPDSTAAGIDAR